MWILWLILWGIPFNHSFDQTSLLAKIDAKSSTISSSQESSELGYAHVQLRWNSVYNASLYIVKVSRDPDFKTYREFTTGQARLYTSGLLNATYHWQVLAYHRNGQRLSQITQGPFTFTIPLVSVNSAKN